MQNRKAWIWHLEAVAAARSIIEGLKGLQRKAPSD